MGFVVLLGMQQAQAFDREDLKRFKWNNSCPKYDLKGASLWDAKLQKANLQGANFQWANLQGVNLQYAKLQGALLKWARLENADLKGASLWDAKLQGAKLQGARLLRANFQGANLKGAKLDSEGVKIAKAKGARNVPEPVWVVSQLDRLKVAKRIGSLPENVNFGIKASTVRQFLTATGLPSKWSTRSKSMSKIELAKIAQKQTLMVVCHQ